MHNIAIELVCKGGKTLIINKKLNLIKRHFQNNFIYYFILAILFLIGVIIGALIVIKFNFYEGSKIIDYFTWIFKYILKGEPEGKNIFYLSLLSNIRTVFIIWILGLFTIGVIGIPLISIWKGIRVGFTVGFLVRNFGFSGFIFTLVGLLLYYLVMIPGILAITAVGLSNSIKKIKYRNRGITNDDFSNYSILMLLFFIVIIISSIIEGIITPFFLNLFRFKL